jgi:hypothetical protein
MPSPVTRVSATLIADAPAAPVWRDQNGSQDYHRGGEQKAGNHA